MASSLLNLLTEIFPTLFSFKKKKKQFLETINKTWKNIYIIYIDAVFL